MKILAFETSCDDTSVAFFEDSKIISLHTLSQIKIHEITAWVVPEVAAREHANNIFIALKNVLDESWISLKKIDYIAITTTPWLIPSLLTWVTVASTLSQILSCPIIPIHHIEAHIFSNLLEREESEISFPAVCLTVSGGHTDIYFLSNMWNREKIGATIDDAAGEAYDKVAKMMEVGYPWGPIISEFANKWKEKIKNKEKRKNIFPHVWLEKESLDFSFSGLKSAVKREIDKRKWISWELTLDDKEEIAFEFQEVVNDVLVGKLIFAGKKYDVKTLMLAGWVSANDNLREKLLLQAGNDFKIIHPLKKIYSMDNAWMVWINAYYKIKYGKFEKYIGPFSV